jgi:hypothetical protein
MEVMHMTVGKATAFAVAFVGAIGLGVAISPSLRSHWGNATGSAVAPNATAEQPSASSTASHARATHARTMAKERPARVPAMAASEPKVQERLKPVLNRGTKLELAADGFTSAEQFATVAHAARNTQIPFVVLKHRVLEEKKSLADAIHEFKPDLNARAEVIRARQEARSDLQAVSG